MILLDEPSLGLAPMLVEEIFEIVQRLNRQEKLTVLLVEQNATLALAHRRPRLRHGERPDRAGGQRPTRCARTPTSRSSISASPRSGARKSYRDVKHYKRRKRWLS